MFTKIGENFGENALENEFPILPLNIIQYLHRDVDDDDADYDDDYAVHQPDPIQPTILMN